MNKIFKSKVFTYSAAILLVIVIAVVAFILKGGTKSAFAAKNSDKLLKAAYSLESSNMEEREYFIANLDKKYEWNLDFTSGSLKNKKDIENLIYITDNDNRKLDGIKLKVKQDSVAILPPKDGYKEGSIYTLHIDKSLQFLSPELDGKYLISFNIKKREVEKVELSSNVKEIDEKQVAIEGNNTLRISGDNSHKLAVGDIIVTTIKGSNGKAAFKIKDVNSSNADLIVECEKPSFEELFKTIDISKEYTVTDKNFTPSQEVVAYREKRFSSTVFAAENDKPILKISKDKVNINVSDIPITKGLNFGLGAELYFPTIDIEHDFSNLKLNSLLLDVKTKQTITPTLTIKGIKGNVTITDESSIRQQLKDLAAKGEVKKLSYQKNIGSIAVPLGATPLEFTMNVNLIAEIKPNGDLILEVKLENETGLGVVYKGGEIKAFKNNKTDGSVPSIELNGGLMIKGGLSTSLGIRAFKVVGIELYVDQGPYVTTAGKIAAKNLSKDSEGLLKFELGWYLEAGGRINVGLGKKQKELGRLPATEVKSPIFDIALYNYSDAGKITTNPELLEIRKGEERMLRYFITDEKTQKQKEVRASDVKFEYDKAQGFSVAYNSLLISKDAEPGEKTLKIEYTKDTKKYSNTIKFTVLNTEASNVDTTLDKLNDLDKEGLMFDTDGLINNSSKIKNAGSASDGPIKDVYYDYTYNNFKHADGREIKKDTIHLEDIKGYDKMLDNITSVLNKILKDTSYDRVHIDVIKDLPEINEYCIDLSVNYFKSSTPVGYGTYIFISKNTLEVSQIKYIVDEALKENYQSEKYLQLFAPSSGDVKKVREEEIKTMMKKYSF